jgi:hypothetical protein
MSAAELSRFAVSFSAVVRANDSLKDGAKVAASVITSANISFVTLILHLHDFRIQTYLIFYTSQYLEDYVEDTIFHQTALLAIRT